jgi:hypothetical protein
MATTVYAAVSATSGTPHVKGAYAQVTASTAFASSRLLVSGIASSVVNLRILLDIATGAAGSETDVVSNLLFFADSDVISGAVAILSVDIPAGTRIAIRCQSTTSGATFLVQLAQDSRAIGSLTAPVTYGVTTITTLGTQLDPGTTINTKGAYAQLTASTTARLDTLLVCVTFDNTLTTAVPGGTSWHVDVATGAAGSEVVVLPDLYLFANVLADAARPMMLQFPLVIASGTRLAMRCDCTRNGSSDRFLRATLVGMQEPATTGGATSVAYLG